MNTAKLVPGTNLKKAGFCCLLGVFVLLCSHCVTAKPLYVVGETVFSIESNIKTYDVFLNGTIEYVTENQIYARCKGPADLAFTPDGRYMFTVSSGSAWVQVVDTVTMTVVYEAHVSGTLEDFSGVVFDSVRNLVYCVDEGQNQLYVLQWDRDSASLTLVPNGRITLPGTSTQDIALDLTNDLLFVSNGTNQIHVYNPSDWSLSHIITLGYEDKVDRIDLDERNQLLYAGLQKSEDAYLVQYDLINQLVSSHLVMEYGSIVGIAVDDSTSFVYVGARNHVYSADSTRTIDKANRVDVYTGDFAIIDQEKINGYISGLGLPVAGVSYSPLTVTKRIVDGTELIGGVHYVSGGDVITYEICFENRSPGPVGNVQVVDALPDQVVYMGADLFGVEGDMLASYNPDTHTYEISMQELDPNSLRCALITVRLKDDLESGLTITNEVSVDSIQTPPVVAQAECVVRHNSLGLNKKVVDDPTHFVLNGIHYVDRGSLLTYELCYTNNNTAPATNVVITDHLPDGVTWVGADLDGAIGNYDPGMNAYTWQFAQLEPNASDCLQITVQVHDDLLPGQQITNRVSIQSNEVPETWASVDVITKYDPLNITKSVLAGAQPNPVNGLPDVVVPGDIITYGLTVENPSNNPTVHNVALVDKLPLELSYIASPDVNGIFGVYDPNYHAVTWLYPTLLPGETLTLTLQARVGLNVGPGTITNDAVVLGSEAPPLSTQVNATVEGEVPSPSGQPKLTVYASEIVGGNFTDELVAVLVLPPQIDLADVDRNVPLILDPGGTQASFQIVYGKDGKVVMDGYFDKSNLVASIKGQNLSRVTLRVTGRLINGEAFVGQTTVPVTGNLLRQN